jgi:tyrosine-protein kinase Etk/Wzc
MSDHKSSQIIDNEQEINLREELDKYLRYWPWFLLATSISIVLAVIYLKTTTPVYETVASIIIKDEESKGGAANAEMAGFSDLGLLGGMGTNSIENEIGIFNSRRMMINVVKALDLNIRRKI